MDARLGGWRRISFASPGATIIPKTIAAPSQPIAPKMCIQSTIVNNTMLFWGEDFLVNIFSVDGRTMTYHCGFVAAEDSVAITTHEMTERENRGVVMGVSRLT